MGLFSTKKTIYVSSSVYNLAGDELNRPNFLKTNLFAAVMNPYGGYLGESIVGGYLSGPGIMQRSFFNWAVRNDVGGLPTLKVSKVTTVSGSIVEPFIPVPVSPAGLVTRVQTAELADGDYEHWAEQWLYANAPEELAFEWLADYNSTTHEISIQYASGTTVIIPAGNYNKNKKYIVAYYYQIVPSDPQPLIVGTKTVGVAVGTLPDTSTFFDEPPSNTGSIDYILAQDVTTEKVYSDATPTETTTVAETPTESFNTILNTWYKTEYLGQTGAASDTSDLESWLYIWERRQTYIDSVGIVESVTVNDMGGGVTETVTITRTGEFLEPTYDHQLNTLETILDLIDGAGGVWIYEIGTGNATLNALLTAEADQDVPGYYPFVPMRLDNVSIRDPAFAVLFAESKKAYKRATGGPAMGGKIDSVLDEIEANPSIGDIDYCYLQWGVSVNVFDPACRRYMYEWFRNQIPNQNTTGATMVNYTNSVNDYNGVLATYNAWTAAQSVSTNPLYGTPKPPYPSLVSPPSSTVRLVADHPQMAGFDNRFTWVSIDEASFTGLGKPGAVPGDIFWINGDSLAWQTTSGILSRLVASATNTDRALDEMRLVKQTGVNTYTVLSVWGMVHENYIYGGKAVRTTLKEGVNDTAESVFIIPLHAPTVNALGIKDFTQMSLSNTFLTFNSYKVVKQKWYQRFLGMLLIVITIVVIAALIAPAAVGAMSGVFGTNAAVGGAFGLSGTAAVVAGAVTNAIAAIVITQAISTISVSLFGEKWGAIIGAIVNFAVSFGIANGFSNITMTQMMNPRVLLSMSSALANGYKGFVTAEITEMQEQMTENQGAYDKAMSDLQDLMQTMGLTNDLLFNPMSLTDTDKGNASGSGSFLPETLDQFIGRTTMTGSDVVDLTLSMVSDYSDLQLTLPKN
jgi:hypothetical protein